MAYTKNTWADGDIVTSEKLNHMEDGIVDAGVMVINDTDGTLDKTWQEISDAMAANTFCVIKTVLQGLDGGSSVCNYLVIESGSNEGVGTSPYYVSAIIEGQTENYYATSATDYPKKRSIG